MSGKKLLSIVAFVGTICIAFALMFRAIFDSNPSVVKAFLITGEIIAFAVTMICAFPFVHAKKHIAWKIIYAIACTAIIALFVVIYI